MSSRRRPDAADVFAQPRSRIRFDWGRAGAATTGAASTFAVVVDVLSFTTSVTVAVQRGIEVHPYEWHDERAAAYAREHEAALAIGRFEAARAGLAETPTLSPARLAAVTGIERLVLPSPNGSTLARLLGERGVAVVAGCLRNRAAVVDWVAGRLRADPAASVCLLAAGERWRSDDSLRPCLEDLLGAGGVAAGLVAAGFGDELSAEARAAAATYTALQDGIPQLVARCVGGGELRLAGFDDDVTLAAEVDVSPTVPVLHALPGGALVFRGA